MNSVASREVSATASSWRAPGAVALLPVFNIPDRAIVAYEAIPRSSARGDRLSVVRSALEAGRPPTPAVLLVRLSGDLLHAAGLDLADLAAEHGAKPSDIT